MPGRIIVLTGPPGAGKTTLAPLLCASAPGPLAVHLHSDDFYFAIKKGYVMPWLPESHTQNQVIVEAVVSGSLAYARGGYEVVLDGIAGDWIKVIFAERARAAGIGLDYVVLLPERDMAAARAKARLRDPLPDYAPYDPLYAGFASDNPGHQVAVGGQSPEMLEVEVRAGLAAGRFALA